MTVEASAFEMRIYSLPPFLFFAASIVTASRTAKAAMPAAIGTMSGAADFFASAASVS